MKFKDICKNLFLLFITENDKLYVIDGKVVLQVVLTIVFISVQ